jgi:hypothetical protein
VGKKTVKQSWQWGVGLLLLYSDSVLLLLGMQVVKLGGPVYRIGVGGGSASSVEVRDHNMSDWYGDLHVFSQQYIVIVYGMFCYSPNLKVCNETLPHPSELITHNLYVACYLVIYTGLVKIMLTLKL